MSSGGKLGLGGIIIVGVLTLLFGGDLGDVLNNVSSVGGGVQSQGSTEFTAEEQALASFSKKVLAGTEDVWTAYFERNGLGEYKSPTMVLYTGTTQSGCGTGSASMGPFYCSADQCLYIDLSFFSSMKSQLGADGDFAYAYVIAHEVGHHVQNLLGTLGQAHQQMARSSQAQSNQISVRLELQADFYAGIWAYYDNQFFSSIEPGDIQEALDAAEKIGDDYLQKQAYGRTVPDAFTHGTSAQREKWLKRGMTGDLSLGDTYSIPYNSL
jgi:predicted metalloprotease